MFLIIFLAFFTFSYSSNWSFNGNSLFYYQTIDNYGKGSLFTQGDKNLEKGYSLASLGMQVKIKNSNIYNGIGTGFSFNLLTSLGMHNYLVLDMQQKATNEGFTGVALSEAYLNYGYKNTSIKVGRQLLSKKVSPFAFSENWSLFRNSFESAMVVNTDIPNTYLIGGVLGKANNLNILSEFSKPYGDSLYLFTIKSNPTSFFNFSSSISYANDINLSKNVTFLFGDIDLLISNYILSFQGVKADKTKAFGTKFNANFQKWNAKLAYSLVDGSSFSVENLATSNQTPLYTQSTFNSYAIKKDASTTQALLGVKSFGGVFNTIYTHSILGKNAINPLNELKKSSGVYRELELNYKRDIKNNTTIFLAFTNQNDNRLKDELQNQQRFRFWVKYRFK